MKKIALVLGVIYIFLFSTVPALALEQKTNIEIPARDKNEKVAPDLKLSSLIANMPYIITRSKSLPNTSGLHDMNAKNVSFNNDLRFSLSENQSSYGVNNDFHNLEPIKPEYLPTTSKELDFELWSVVKGSTGRGIIDVVTALVTGVFLHEIGHYVVADYVGAEGNRVDFLTSRDGQFFLGSSTVTEIDDNSRLPYNMGGEVAADLTFEYALSSYRKAPTLYNKALMLFSGTDLLRYSLYAFTISDGNDHLDPIAVNKYGGVSKEAIISAAVLKTALNAYRIHTGNDTIIPYFMVDKYSATLMLKMHF